MKKIHRYRLDILSSQTINVAQGDIFNLSVINDDLYIWIIGDMGLMGTIDVTLHIYDDGSLIANNVEYIGSFYKDTVREGRYKITSFHVFKEV